MEVSYNVVERVVGHSYTLETNGGVHEGRSNGRGMRYDTRPRNTTFVSLGPTFRFNSCLCIIRKEIFLSHQLYILIYLFPHQLWRNNSKTPLDRLNHLLVSFLYVVIYWVTVVNTDFGKFKEGGYPPLYDSTIPPLH